MSQQLDAIEEMAMQWGSVCVNNTLPYSANMDAIYVAEDTEFAEIYDKDGNDIRDFLITDKSIAVKGGVILAPVRGQYFTRVQLISGSVVIILRNNEGVEKAKAK